jgi:3-isopropylmalate dehydrogenase
LRIRLDLFAGIRPARRMPGLPPALSGDPPIDFVVVRENTEGIFASLGGGVVLGDSVATDTQVVTRRGTERVVRTAFELARSRGRVASRVTCVDKANILRSFAFFRKVFDEVAAEYPDVAADHLYVDAAAMEMVRRPGRFDVVVTENLLGDILSDLAAGLVGGLGVAPSADVGEKHAVFQPCHGTAPDIAGLGIANPTAAILSAAMLLDYLSDRSGDPHPRAAARRIEEAVAQAVRSGAALTRDVGGDASTAQAAGAVVDRLG